MMEKDVASTATPMNRRWRRRLTGTTAIAAGMVAAFVAVPAVQAGASTAITTVTQGSTGTVPTAGTPVPKATAKIAVTASAVDPTNGDVAEINNLDQVFVVVNAANELATDFGLGTTGTLTQGDVYLVAGTGFTGWNTPIADGGKATSSNLGKPTRVAFDASGDLLIASKTGTKSFLMAVPAATGSQYGFSMTAGDLYYLAGYISATTSVPSPGITLPSAYTFTGIAASSGLESGGVQNVAVATNAATSTGVSYLNFTSGSLSLFGTTEAAGSVTEIAGGGTAACTSGAQNLPATGASAFTASPAGLYADGSGNVYVGDAGTCDWVLPVATGTLTIDGASTSVTAGKAYKVAGDGTSPYTTAPAKGTANAESVGDTLGITEDLAGNLVFGMGTGGTAFAGAYVIANSSGTYYGQAMTAGDLYAIAGGTPTVLQSFTTPVVGGVDSSGNLYLADTTAHKLYELTGGPTGVAKVPTSTTTTVSATPTSPQKQGTSVKFTATVSPKAAGTVKFTAGATTLGTVPVTTATGTTFVTETTLVVGTYTVTATFTPTTPATFAGSSGTLPYKITTATAPGTTTYNTNPTTNTTPTTKGTDTIVQQIPKTGTFKLTVTKATVHLTRPKVSGATESSHGTLPGAQVTTTRNTVPGWTVSGQVGTFRSGTHTFPGSDLGWTPAVPSQTTPSTGVHAGAVVAPGTVSGLSAASTWAKATAGKGIGTTVLGAKLTLVIPSTTPPGTYTATFTVSAI